MNILIFSPMGDGVGLAHQLIHEGHQVQIHFVEENDSKQGQGMIWRCTDWQKAARAADFVIFDNNGHGPKADNLRKLGVKVWCGGLIADRMEIDRVFGMAVMRRAGLPIPETFDFSNGAEALDIVNEHFKAFDRSVVKLNDGAAASTSYVAKDRQDMLAQLEAWIEANPEGLGHGGIVQRFIPGIEISIEGWFNGERFLYPYNWTMEDKKLLAGNLGPNVGCAFSMVRNMKAREPRMAKEFLDPLVPYLQQAGYTGQVDVNTIVSEGDGQPYALEFTPRPGYEGTQNLILLQAGFGASIARALGLEEGEDLVGGADRPWDFAAALRLWIPPYPFEAPTKPLQKELYGCVEGVPVTKMPTVDEGFIPYDVFIDEKGDPVLAGTCGIVGVTVARGRAPDEAIRGCIKIAERMEVPNLAWRADAGARVAEQLPLVEGLLR